jgi:hypothetical protein
LIGVLDPEGHVGASFFDQPFFDVAGGDQFAVLSSQGPVIDGEFHLDGGRIHRDVRERGAQFAVGQGFPDKHVLKAGQADNVTGMRFWDLDAFQSFEVEDGGDFAGCRGAVIVSADGGVADPDSAGVNFSESDSA